MNADRIKYYLLRMVVFPFAFLPYPTLHMLGKWLGSLAYYLLTDFRKRTLSNLALATELDLSPNEIRSLAKSSFQNLMITCLEYAKFSIEKKISKIAVCENPEAASELLKDGKGIIFFCGHLANWETLFLEGTSRMPGVAIGKPVKNSYLYDWILSIRQKFGGKIITPKNAIKEGLRALRQGKFLGVVGDQGMPDSGYSCNFLGRKAWTSPIPALLAYRSGRPLLTATAVRKNGKYHIRYSEPLWPDTSKPMEEEIDRLMKASLRVLEDCIKLHPDQWLWQHNRWKQQLPGKINRSFRQDCIAVILPQVEEKLQELVPHLPSFRLHYPHEFITFFVPKDKISYLSSLEEEIVPYTNTLDLLKDHLQYKLVFNLSGLSKVSSHFLHKLSAFTVVDERKLHSLAGFADKRPFSEILERAVSHAR